MLFAHSIIRHHHHEEEETAQHQGSHHDDHEDIDNNFLGQAFSHFQHEQGGTVTYETASADYQCAKVNFDKKTFFLVQYIVQVLYKPPLKHAESPPFHFTFTSFTVTSLLRGPPVLVA